MRISILVLGLVWAGALCGQSRSHHKMNWQDYCFNNPGSPVCPGHEYAVKRPAPAKSPTSRDVVRNPVSSRPSMIEVGDGVASSGTPSVIEVIDWRFVDPMADGLAGFNFRGLAASPLARGLIGQLGARQGLSEADIAKLFERLSGVDQIALSIRDNRIVAMVTGRVADSTLPTPAAGLKIAPVSGNAMLFGHADAVDEALRRIQANGSPAESTRFVPEQQGASEFWAIGTAGLAGPEAVSTGVKRFSMTLSTRDRLASEAAFELDGAPPADTLRTWQTALSATTVEGNTVYSKLSMEAGDAQQKFSEIATSPVGVRLAALVEAARYVPAPIQPPLIGPNRL